MPMTYMDKYIGRGTTCVLGICVLTAALFNCVCIDAADLTPSVGPAPVPVKTSEGWTFSFAPYFWAAGLSGNVGSFGLPKVDIHESFGDILSDLDFGFMAAGEARYDRFSILTDMIYARVTTDS